MAVKMKWSESKTCGLPQWNEAPEEDDVYPFKLNQSYPAPDAFFTAYIPIVSDRDYFPFLIAGSNQVNQLHKLEADATASNPSVLRSPQKYDPCLTKDPNNPNDDTIYRSKIMRFDWPQKKCEVLFVDYGYQAEVNLQDLREIRSCYMDLPAQALWGVLAGFQDQQEATIHLQSYSNTVLFAKAVAVYSECKFGLLLYENIHCRCLNFTLALSKDSEFDIAAVKPKIKISGSDKAITDCGRIDLEFRRGTDKILVLRNLPHNYVSEMPCLLRDKENVLVTIDPKIEIVAILEVIMFHITNSVTYNWRDLYEGVKAAMYIEGNKYVTSTMEFLHLTRPQLCDKSTVRSRCGLVLKHIKRALDACCTICGHHSLYLSICYHCKAKICHTCCFKHGQNLCQCLSPIIGHFPG